MEAKIAVLEGQIAEVHAQEEEIRVKLKSVETESLFFYRFSQSMCLG